MARTVRVGSGRLYPPGTRKGNRFWLYRGTVAGRGVEFSTKQIDKADAIGVAQEYIAALSRGAVPETLTFKAVAEMYVDHRQSSEQDRRFIERLTESVGNVLIHEIRPAHMTTAIRTHYPNAAPATINRQVWVPYGAVTHWAADQGWCAYRRVTKMKEVQPQRMAAPDGVGDLMISATEGEQRAYITLLMCQGWRQSEALALRWDGVDLGERALTFFVPKARRWKTVAMADEVKVELANLTRSGVRVFSFGRRENVYAWWNPLVARLGYPDLRPHAFRHAFAMGGRIAGAGDDDLVEMGSWTNPRSLASYTRKPTGRSRDFLGKIRGKSGKVLK